MNLYKMCVYLNILKNNNNNNNESIWTNSLKIYILVKIKLTWMSKENQINKKVSLIFTPLFPHTEVSTKTPKRKVSDLRRNQYSILQI